MTSQMPRILSPGLPHEIHADRIVTEMLHYIAREHAGTFLRIYCLYKTRRAGNPKAQRRLIAEIMRVGHPTVIEVQYRTGTRGRYVIYVVDWCPYDETRERMILPGDVLPAKPWLSCGTTRIEGRVPGQGDHRPEIGSQRMLHITHHALSRLAQRVGARTVDDLIAAARVIWMAYFARVTQTRNKNRILLPSGTRLPLPLPNGMGDAIAVLQPHATGDGSSVVVTIVPADKEILCTSTSRS